MSGTWFGAMGFALTDEGRRSVLRAYERRLSSEVRHPMFGYTVTYRRVLEVQVRLFAAYLLGAGRPLHALSDAVTCSGGDCW